MLRIRADLVEAMVAHARRDHPDEACGVIAGPEGSDSPERFIPMLNAARSPTFYEFDSMDLLRLYRDASDDMPAACRDLGHSCSPSLALMRPQAGQRFGADFASSSARASLRLLCQERRFRASLTNHRAAASNPQKAIATSVHQRYRGIGIC